jgi:hypothetical protein
MPFLLARLGPVLDPDTREVLVRGQVERQAVGPQVRKLREGAVVLLCGTKPPWLDAHTASLSTWPTGLPGVQALWSTHRTGVLHVTVDPECGSRGVWVLDERGKPCELGFGRSGGPMAFVLNYAGWRISDFPEGPTEVVVCTTALGTVWIVTPTAVPQPGDGRPSSYPAATAARFPVALSERSPDEPAARSASEPASIAPPLPVTRFGLHLRFQDIQFADGGVTVPVHGHAIFVATDQARHVYQEVRELFDEVLPQGVEVVGTLRGGQPEVTELRGLDAMAALFDTVEHRAFVRRSCAAESWLDAHELAAHGSGGRRDPARLLDIPEFGFDRRADAFRRLIAIRDPEARVSVLPGRAMVIPLAASDGGAPWYAWETVIDDHATYIFRPTTDEARDAVLAWTRQPSRQELLGDKALQAELAFVRRVRHLDGGDDALGSWWAGVCRVVGR